jgi:dTDP-4-amino-4,6-dideoxygalactose transaminase
VGSIADLTTFSFFPTKNITTGEGGAISSTNIELLEKAKRFSRQGLVRNQKEFKIINEGPWHQEVHQFGLNYRMPDILCALGISQLERLYSFKEQRTKVFDIYFEQLSEVDQLVLPAKREYADPMWHLYPVQVPSMIRQKVFESLHKSGIKVQVNYFPANRHPVFARQGYNVLDTPNSNEFYSRQISLPMMANSDFLSPTKIKEVCDQIKLALKDASKNDL